MPTKQRVEAEESLAPIAVGLIALFLWLFNALNYLDYLTGQATPAQIEMVLDSGGLVQITTFLGAIVLVILFVSVSFGKLSAWLDNLERRIPE